MKGFIALEDGTFFALMTRQPVKVAPPWNNTVAPCGNVKLLTLPMVCHGKDRVPGLLSLPVGET